MKEINNESLGSKGLVPNLNLQVADVQPGGIAKEPAKA